MLLPRRIVGIFCALILLGALGNDSVFAQSWKVLPGHVPNGLSQLPVKGSVPATNQLRLAIGLPLRDSAGLDHLLNAIYNPASPSYHQFLTPDEFANRFGPTEQDYQTVQQYAVANGLTVVGTHGNRLVLDVVGQAAAVEKAFHVRLNTYQHPTENRQFYAPNTEPTVDVSLPVVDIQGLSDYSKPHPHLKRANAASPHNGSGSGGAFMGNDFRNAYASGATLTGSGQIVGLVQFDGFYARDIAQYAAAAGGGRASIQIQTVLLDGYNGVPTTGANSGNPEVSLDIEMAMAMAPGLSKIVVFEAGPTGLQNDVLNSMAQNSTVKNLSCSWGWSGGPSATTDNIFKQMSTEGQSFFNASGDSDAFTVGISSINGVDNPNNANSPSSSPNVTEVGGTTLTMNGTGGSFASETVWNWGGGTGSSGGVSSYYAIPAWQSGINMGANQGSTSMRNIPDVAMTADNVYVIYGNGSVGTFGGTSCAAPLWAGFMALVNQQAATLGHASIGFLNPAIYAIGKGQNGSFPYASCFHDTTSGNNTWASSPSSYPAVSGYDLCTGWGSPNGLNLISALAGSADSLGILAQGTIAFSGVVGGPFMPSPASLQLTNDSGSSLNWRMATLPTWLKASNTNGTLGASSAESVSLSIATLANTMKAGNYSVSLSFTNVATKVVQKLPITLSISQALALSTTNGFAAVGPVGGPFAPNSQVLTLNNLGGNSLAWSLVKTSAWITVSGTNGSLLGGNQANLTVSLNASAITLKAGIYKSTLRFLNGNALIGVVPFTLSIGQPIIANGGFETGTFASWTQSGNTAYTMVTRYNAFYVHSGIYGAELGPSGLPGYLSQTMTTIPGQTYAVSLWLRNASAAIPNWFQIQWNGNTIYEKGNMVNTSWTNLQFIVTASDTTSTLQLGFQDDPDYLGLDDVSVKAVSAAVVKATGVKNNDLHLAWNTSPGTLYQAQYKTNLLQADWVNLGSPTSANSSSFLLIDTNALQVSPQRFYRLVPLTVP